MKSLLVLLIIAGIIFIIDGINVYEDPNNRGLRHGHHNTPMDYESEIKGFSYVIAGTVFIISGLYLMVRINEK